MTAQWLAAMPADPTRDRAVNNYAQHVAGQAPHIAAPLVQSISDGDMRNAAIEVVARAWLVLDRPAAEAWLGAPPPAAGAADAIARGNAVADRRLSAIAWSGTGVTLVIGTRVRYARCPCSRSRMGELSRNSGHWWEPSGAS